MGVVVNTTGREYWHALLGAGGFTAVPRWTRDPNRASPSTKSRSRRSSPPRCTGWRAPRHCR
jgi:hypothetical protein